MAEDMGWAARVRDAVDNDRFKILYQPIVSLQSQQVQAYEVLLRLPTDDGKTIKSAKVALGAVAPTPIRAPQAEKVLAGAKAGDDVFAQAGLAAAQDAKPITDHRGSAEYRRDVVAVLTKRALQAALENGRKQ